MQVNSLKLKKLKGFFKKFKNQKDYIYMNPSINPKIYPEGKLSKESEKRLFYQ